MSTVVMQNVFNDSTNEIGDTNAKGIDYESVVKNLLEVVWSINMSVEPYEITYLNDPLTRTPGSVYSKAATTIGEWQKTIHPDDQERILDEVVNVLNTGTGNYAYRALRGKDNYRYVRDRVTVFYEDGKPVRLDGITTDIDDIRRSRRDLELSQQRLKSIVEALPDPVFISTQDTGKAIFANEMLFEVYGMKPNEFLGKRVIQFYQNFEGRKQYLEMLIKNGSVQNHELMLKNSKGASYWVSASTMPLEFQNESCHITILQDITVRKSLERELKQSNDRYYLAVEGTNDVIWEYDFKKSTSYLSPQFWESMDLKPKKNPLDKDLLVKFIHEEDRNEFLQAIQNKFETKDEDLEMETRMVGQDGKILWVFVKAKILYSGGKGRPRKVVGSLSNITSLKQAQSRLRESEAKYKLISENSSDCICLQTPDGTFIFVSPSSIDVIGYDPSELEQLRLREFIAKDALIKVSQAMLKVVNQSTKMASVTFMAKHKNGNNVWLESRGGLITDSEGAPLYLLTSTRDVTERFIAAQKLRESQERYKLITENSHDIVSLMDPEGNYDFVSPSVKEILGYEVYEMIGQNSLSFIHPEDLPEVMRLKQIVLENKLKDEKINFRFRNKQGDWRWLEGQGGVILNDAGEIIYVRSNKRDITEKILTEQKLQEKEKQYKLVSENSGDVIALQDFEGKASFISPSVKFLLGYEQDALLDTFYSDLIHPEEQPFVQAIINEAVKNKSKNVKATYRIQTKDEQWIWVESSFSTIEDAKGNFLYLQSSTRDISERIKALDKERQLGKLKSSFISMASHEFRTPLTTIQSSNELINMYLDADPEPNPKLKKHVGRIRTELERMNTLLKDVFTLGRLDVGKTAIKKDITSLTGILKQVVLENSVQYRSRDIKISVAGKERQVELDSQLISHSLSNLINNALKYSEGRPDPEIIVTYKKVGLQIEVKDYGIGIPEADQKGLFESFSRASNVGDIDGTGLGLIIVKNFVEIHGGSITYKSELNKGTSFFINLPDV
ncbi:PAS domain S-box protein [Roseivirga echinicomitans]